MYRIKTCTVKQELDEAILRVLLLQ